ncbi:unnamed protein product [Ceratitis capitata]|uniref:(Mediterranean fruit fly) hypothetical protein n=1 Tax=Ceratitis capitata TaxID=7213 RepID=A0A811UUN4_CERCA|nr:unnamed protein product [Ceratitis capitata]
MSQHVELVSHILSSSVLAMERNRLTAFSCDTTWSILLQEYQVPFPSSIRAIPPQLGDTPCLGGVLGLKLSKSQLVVAGGQPRQRR